MIEVTQDKRGCLPQPRSLSQSLPGQATALVPGVASRAAVWGNIHVEDMHDSPADTKRTVCCAVVSTSGRREFSRSASFGNRRHQAGLSQLSNQKGTRVANSRLEPIKGGQRASWFLNGHEAGIG